MTDRRRPFRFSPKPVWLLVILAGSLVTCVPGTISDQCPRGLVVAGNCHSFDCPGHECLVDQVCVGERCVEIACVEVDCGPDQACAGGNCYPEDCQWRNCPGLGEVCVDDDCLQTSCVGVVCPDGQRCAAGSCYPIDCDTKNCPGYGEVCIAGECVERTCVGVDCPAGQRCAGGYCYPENCREVGCFGEGEVCIDGICQRRACAGVECQDGFRCANGWCYPQDCSGFECADPWEVCHQGECQQADCVGVQCPPGTRCSRGECLPLDCVQQGQGCAEQEVCLDGICIPEDCVFVDCPAGEFCAADLNCYPEDCPDLVCPDYSLCVDSQCTDQLCVDVPCPFGQVCAAGNCYPSDCPDQPCGPGEVCENGMCIAQECAGGRCCPASSCTLENQCRTEICGGITYTCLYNPQAGMTVWSDAGQACTDSDACTLNDGCLGGECRGEPVLCDPGETCVLGGCRCGSTGPDCQGGEVCCGSDCVDLDTSLAHCGMCNSPCSIPNASEQCLNGECQLLVCQALFDDCDDNGENGCETSLETLSDCGACGVTCLRDHATASCAGGSCAIAQCDAGWDDCDGQDPNGCETALNTLSDCGACGVVCRRDHATASCAGGSCVIAQCDAGWGDCDGVDPNGCETPLNTLTDCGGCGQSCFPAHGTGSCPNGSCQIQDCQALWDDCDGQVPNGCETPLDTLSDCGSCDTSCSRPNATATCTGGSCATASCHTSYFDANGADQDGCECRDAADAGDACAVSSDVGTISAANPQASRSGTIVHRTGVRLDQDCYFVNYQRPAPGSGTFRVRLDPDPGNLTADVWRGDCTHQECDESTVFETRCSSLGGSCQSGNGAAFRVCVHARAGQDNLCQSYTLRFEFLP